jgi:hypothetical protein
MTTTTMSLADAIVFGRIFKVHAAPVLGPRKTVRP